jgi:hypothetical protein
VDKKRDGESREQRRRTARKRRAKRRRGGREKARESRLTLIRMAGGVYESLNFEQKQLKMA